MTTTSVKTSYGSCPIFTILNKIKSCNLLIHDDLYMNLSASNKIIDVIELLLNSFSSIRKLLIKTKKKKKRRKRKLKNWMVFHLSSSTITIKIIWYISECCLILVQTAMKLQYMINTSTGTWLWWELELWIFHNSIKFTAVKTCEITMSIVDVTSIILKCDPNIEVTKYTINNTKTKTKKT